MLAENKSVSWILILIGVFGLIFLGKHLFMAPKYSGGQVAPDFSAELINGAPFTLSDLRGDYVLLDFWATWCGPCRAEMPVLKQMYQRYYHKSMSKPHNFHIVSVALEGKGDLEKTKRIIDKLGLAWEYHIFDPISDFRILDAKIGTNLYGVRSVPTKYLIGPEGTVLGVNMSFEEMTKVIDGKWFDQFAGNFKDNMPKWRKIADGIVNVLPLYVQKMEKHNGKKE